MIFGHNQAVVEIQEILGEDSISTDDDVLLLHGYSSWSTSNVDTLPVAVAYPKSTQETAEIAKICYKYKVPISELPCFLVISIFLPALTGCAIIVPFSGGSSLEGNFSAPYGGISVDFTYMDKILAFHENE